MAESSTKNVIDFYRYPPVGQEDWRYGFAAAQVRCLETQLIHRNTYLDMAGASTFEEAMELLNGTPYAMSNVTSFVDIENMLLERRAELRDLFVDLVKDNKLVELLREREDFANMRLAIRRIVTDRPIGTDYIPRGSVPAEEFEEIFETEDYSRFPEYLQEAVEAAITGYYENKDIRKIDFELDRVQSKYRLKRAREINSIFLESMYRIRIDLNNIRTLLRLKMVDDLRKDVFLEGGFVDLQKFSHAIDLNYEAITPLFFATPYFEIIERGISYLTSEQSFLGLEKECQDYTLGFLNSTRVITAGPQPVIAYLGKREIEIRTLRMVLSAKKNNLEMKLIQDRLPENI